MTDCIDFSLLRSSRATQSQVSEFQPAVEKLLTEYFMFGYQFEPSTWLADVNHYRKDFYNPINDLLNPLNQSPDEILQKMSIDMIEEQLLKEKFQNLKQKQAILRMVPANLRNVYSYLYDSGALLNASSENINALIGQLVQGGQISVPESGELRRLLQRNSLFNQMATAQASQDSSGEFEAVMNRLVSTHTSRGANPQVARGIARQGLSRALSEGYTSAGELSDRATVYTDAYAESLAREGDSPTQSVRTQQFGAEVDRMSRETGILQSGSTGFGTRSSMPLGVGDEFGTDMTTSGVRSSSFNMMGGAWDPAPVVGSEGFLPTVGRRAGDPRGLAGDVLERYMTQIDERRMRATPERLAGRAETMERLRARVSEERAEAEGRTPGGSGRARRTRRRAMS